MRNPSVPALPAVTFPPRALRWLALLAICSAYLQGGLVTIALNMVRGQK